MPRKHRRFTPRRWPLFAVLGIALVAIVAVFVLNRPTAVEPVTQLPPPIVAEQQVDPTPEYPPPMPIAPGRVTRVYVPGVKTIYSISSEVLALDNCRALIDPPLTGHVYGCTDFEYPSTSSTSLSVLAGHSSNYMSTEFNKLYQQGNMLVGTEVWVQTETSNGVWLAYQIEFTREPLKTELPMMEEIWGSPAVSTAGNLVLVTCIQNDDKTPSTRNFVAVAEFIGVR